MQGRHTVLEVLWVFLEQGIQKFGGLTHDNRSPFPAQVCCTATAGWRSATPTSGGRLIFQIFGALAEFERNLIRERTQARLKAARARGRKGGRPKALDAKKVELAYRLYNEKKHTIKEICQMLGISKPSLYAYLEQRSGNDNSHTAHR